MIRIRTVLFVAISAVVIAIGLALPAAAPAASAAPGVRHHAVTVALALPAAAAGVTALTGSVMKVKAKRACKLSYRVTTVTANEFEIKFLNTCGISYRAWRRWGGSDTDLGTYRKCPGCSSNYSVACDVTSCQSHPDGAPFCYGWQRKDTGATHTIGGCSSKAARIIALPPGPRSEWALAA